MQLNFNFRKNGGRDTVSVPIRFLPSLNGLNTMIQISPDSCKVTSWQHRIESRRSAADSLCLLVVYQTSVHPEYDLNQLTYVSYEALTRDFMTILVLSCAIQRFLVIVFLPSPTQILCHQLSPSGILLTHN